MKTNKCIGLLANGFWRLLFSYAHENRQKKKKVWFGWKTVVFYTFIFTATNALVFPLCSLHTVLSLIHQGRGSLKLFKFLSRLLLNGKSMGGQWVCQGPIFISTQEGRLVNPQCQQRLKNAQLSLFHFNGTITKAHHGARTITAHYLGTMWYFQCNNQNNLQKRKKKNDTSVHVTNMVKGRADSHRRSSRVRGFHVWIGCSCEGKRPSIFLIDMLMQWVM